MVHTFCITLSTKHGESSPTFSDSSQYTGLHPLPELVFVAINHACIWVPVTEYTFVPMVE